MTIHSGYSPILANRFKAVLFAGVMLSLLIGLPSQAEQTAGEQADTQSSPWTWGIGVISSRDVYADFDSRVVPFPMVIYQGDRFHLYGPFAHYDLVQGKVNLALQLNPVLAGYQASDSPILQGMDDRDYSMAGGLALDYRPGRWHFNINATHDLLGVYDGYEATAGVEYRIGLGNFLIEPGARAIYQSRDYVDYYYGVTAAEALGWRPQYEGDSVVNQQLSAAFSHRKVAGGALRLQITHTRYGDAIDDSPLTDRNTALGVNVMYSRPF